MTQTANNYGTVLFELGVGKETVEEMKRIFSLTGVLPRVLDCPVVSGREKHRLIEQLFPKEVWNFLKEMCDHGNVSEMDDVFKAYTRCYDEANGILKTVMYCAGTPDEEQLALLQATLENKELLEQERRARKRIGLVNIQSRLKLMYGDAGGLTFGRKEGMTIVTVKLPIDIQEGR